MHHTARFRILELLETLSDTEFYGVATEFDRLIVALRMSNLHRVLFLLLARLPLPMPTPPYPLIPVSADS
jgi:hypothetical protein